MTIDSVVQTFNIAATERLSIQPSFADSGVPFRGVSGVLQNATTLREIDTHFNTQFRVRHRNNGGTSTDTIIQYESD